MKILITGSDGLLGRDVSQVFVKKFPETTMESTEAFLDIKDYDRVAIEFERLIPSVVINCAAYSHVDGCEDHPDEAYRVNRDGAFHLARASRHIKARFIHISTDYVFDGEKRSPYKETDAAVPLGIYGQSKLEGERAVLEEWEDSLIIRTSSLFGKGGENFGSKVIARCERGEEVMAAIDMVSSPTYTVDLARAIEKLAETHYKGIVHFVNSGICSKFDFARSALRIKKIDETLLIPIRMDQLQLKAKRPAYSALDHHLYTQLTGETPRPWEETLKEYLEVAGIASRNGTLKNGEK
jgi:dTDP-4-dehydrorhamnose reductase